jgi:hypothetical protein
MQSDLWLIELDIDLPEMEEEKCELNPKSLQEEIWLDVLMSRHRLKLPRGRAQRTN